MSDKITIGDVDLTGILYRAVVRGGVDNGRAFTYVDAVLRCDHKALSSIDLTRNLRIEVKTGDDRKIVFSGLVVTTETDQTIFRIKGEDMVSVLSKSRITLAFGEGITQSEAFYYIGHTTFGKMAQPQYISLLLQDKDDPEKSYVDEKLTLADMPRLFSKRRYVFIAPLPFCHIAVQEVKFANAWLYQVEGSGSADDQNITRRLPDKNTAGEWPDDAARVRLYVMASGFIDAFEKGQRQLSQLLDFLSFGANLGTASYQKIGKSQFLNYDRDRTLTDITETNWSYVRDTSEANRYWLKCLSPHRSNDPFIIQQDDPLVATYPLFAKLLEEDADRLTNTERSILNALHALRQARQASNVMDGLVHVWNAIEFLVYGYKVDTVFTAEDLKAIAYSAKDAIASRYIEDKLAARQKRIEDFLQGLNNPPLRTRWEAFRTKYAIAIPEEENDFLWEVRKRRNDHQHGRTATVDREEINRMCNIIEKAIIALAQTFSQ